VEGNSSPTPQYRGRTIVLIITWMLGYAGLIYGVGRVLLSLHGGPRRRRAIFVFLTIAVAYAALFIAFPDQRQG